MGVAVLQTFEEDILKVYELAEFFAERFKPAGANMDEPYSYKSIGGGTFVIEKTLGQHLIEQYTEDAEAFLMWLESKNLEIKEKPLE